MRYIWDEDFKRDGCLISDINAIEEEKSIKFPKLYIDMMLYRNGGDVTRDRFNYIDIYTKEKKINSCSWFLKIDSLSTKESDEEVVGRYLYLIDHPDSKILSKDSYEFVEWYLLDPPEFFPKNLVAFGEDGGGNLTCFDYRDTKKDPPIIFWCHDDNQGKDVHFIANNFEEFINMLHGPEDVDSEGGPDGPKKCC